MTYATTGIGTSVPYDQMEIGGDFTVKWVICFNDNNDDVSVFVIRVLWAYNLRNLYLGHNYCRESSNFTGLQPF